jgi:MerR family transcriptional regulator, light-induced transcriptional regulator
LNVLIGTKANLGDRTLVLKRIMPTAPLTVTLQEAALQLGLHYMTVYRYVRTGKLPATQDGVIWRVKTSDVTALEQQRLHASGSRSRPREMTATEHAFEARLVAGDSAGAWWLVEGRLGGGLEPSGVMTTLLSPALRSIGARWASGELTVADEHRATATAQRIIGRLGLQFGRPGRSRGTVLLAAPAGDLHTLPVAMVADLLRWRRFDVIELGANTPADALADAALGAERLVAVGIAATTAGLDRQVIRSVRAVRSATNAPIILGGSAIRDAAHARELGSDRWTGRDGTSVVEAVEDCVESGPAGADAYAS